MMRGLCSRAKAAPWRRNRLPRWHRDHTRPLLNHLPDMLSGIPWVRCPFGKAHAMMVSPGFDKCHEDGLVRLGA